MWHHYTNAHNGICLEYSTKDILDIYQINSLFPIFYVNKLPDIVQMMLKKTNPKFSLWKYMAIHKLIDWSYEDEWRLLYDVGSWYMNSKDVPKEFWEKGKTVRFIQPSRIILGIAINEVYEKKIREIAQKANIPVVRALQTEYGLKIM